MAGRPKAVAVSPDNQVDEQNFTKAEVPRKKTFKITSVTKSSQRAFERGGSGDLLSQENDLDSLDDLDETIDSHTEDLSSEIYDTNSKATDIDNQDPLLTPEELIKENEPKEKPARFKVVKVETKEPFRRGRWMCLDYLDAPEKTENKQEEINVKSGSSSAANSVHYIHGVDDPAKNPLFAGATGTVYSQQQSSVARDASTVYMQGEAFKPIQPASSQPDLIPASQSGSSFLNHSAQSSGSILYAAQAGFPDQSVLQSLPVMNNRSLRSGGSMPVLPPLQQGQTQTSQSLSGNIPYPTPNGHSHSLAAAQGSMISSSGHSLPASVIGLVSSSHQPLVQAQEYVSSANQVQINASQGQHVPAYQQQIHYGMSSQPSGYSLNSGTVSSAGSIGISLPNRLPQRNHLPTSAPSRYDGATLNSIISRQSEGEDSRMALGAGLAPLEIAVGGITASPADDDITEEAGTSAVAIDNKIEQAMDLVKSHLMYAVREEVEVLKELIKDLMERMQKLEQENKALRSEASPEILAQLPPPPPPVQSSLLQQFMHTPSSSSST